MNYIVDIIIAMISVIIIIYYTARGFVRSILDVVKLALSVIFTYFAVPSLFNVTNPTVRFTLYTITFLVVFLLLSLIFSLVDRAVKKLPVVKTANRFMGFLLGVGFAYLFVSTMTILLWILDPYVSDGILHEQLQVESTLFRFFSEHGAFSLFM